MKRLAMTVLLKDEPGLIEKYERYHANPWPEVVGGIKECGIQRIFIYRFDRHLFMIMEVLDDFDLERDMPKYMEHPKAKEWDELMRTFQEPVEGAPQDGTWVLMKEVFALEN